MDEKRLEALKQIVLGEISNKINGKTTHTVKEDIRKWAGVELAIELTTEVMETQK